MVALSSLGCKLNQAEVESLAWSLGGVGYPLAEAGHKAEVFIVNTCTVTQAADAKARHLIREIRRGNPSALIMAIGCYAERDGSQLLACGADLTLGNRDKNDLLRLVKTLRPTSGCRNKTRPRRTRALVKIQEGCDLTCSYCIVPRVRGRGRSRPIEEVVADVRARVAQGHREVVLTGTELGAYGREGPEHSGLASLVKRLLEETEVERLRLSSLQPQEITPTLLELWQNPRLCPHLHIPLQSGSDAILRSMGRLYSTASCRETLARCRQAIPDLAVTTDVIVGFPGERETEFRESYNFCHETGFARIHIFPYSPREGTAAAAWPQVDAADKKRRTRMFLALARESSKSYAHRFLGRTLEVLWEGRVASGIWVGHTGNYLRAMTSSHLSLSGRRTSAQLVATAEDGLWAKIPPSL